MNERIRELWNQSRYPSGRGHDEEKFAELIVRECCQFEKTFEGDAGLVARRFSHKIKEHFGVEP